MSSVEIIWTDEHIVHFGPKFNCYFYFSRHHTFKFFNMV